MSPTRGFQRTMAARRRLELQRAKVIAIVRGYEETEERYILARAKQDDEAAVDRMVDAAIERALLGD